MSRSRSMKLTARLASPALLLGMLWGCSTDSPTAPQQEPAPPPGPPSASWVLTISVSPDIIEVGATDPVTVSVDVRRADNNQAPATGTTIVLSTSLGEFLNVGSGLSSLALSTVQGRTQTLLFPGSLQGTAVLTAQLENSAGQTTFLVRDQIVPIVAAFAFQNTDQNLSVRFQDTSTGDPTRFLWDFGDGATSTEQNPTHTYALPGDYVVTFTASNDDSSDTINGPINVTLNPEKVIEASFESTIDALDAVFRDTSTGSPTRWKWSFGDGTSSTQQNPSHRYRREGIFVVTLTASNNVSSDSVSETVTIEFDPETVVEASFVATIDDRTVTFQDTSTGEPTVWSWNFGDGSGSSLQNPTHTYAADGSFVVTLTAANASTSSSTSETVTIEGDESGEFFITGVAPNSGPESGGTAVTVTGNGFSDPLRVSFGGVLATTVSVTSTDVSVITPPFDVPDDVDCVPVQVKVELGSGTSGSVDGGFTYIKTGADCD